MKCFYISGEALIVLFPKSFSGYVCFGLTPRNNIILARAIILVSLSEYFRKKDFRPSLLSKKWDLNIKRSLRIDS